MAVYSATQNLAALAAPTPSKSSGGLVDVTNAGSFFHLNTSFNIQTQLAYRPRAQQVYN